MVQVGKNKVQYKSLLTRSLSPNIDYDWKGGNVFKTKLKDNIGIK